MKKFISKVKKVTKDFFTNKAAFSLVELIVVIAIMAVMAAVLAPALLGYVEKSRMQKDDSAMDEVVNAVQLSLADQEIYDEVLEHSVWDNVSCYIDQKEESKFASHKVTLKAEHGDKKEQYMFGDEARLLDETVYYAAGNMRGLTITFSPSESGDTYDFANGILNKFVGRKTGILSENPELYNRLRSVIGDKLDTISQTYRNSDYTIFIRVGSTGGSEAVMQDAIQVWGQFNGTNLAEKDHKYELSSGRVVGSAGANDVSNNQTNNENGNVDFSENPIKEFTIIFSNVNSNGRYHERGVATTYRYKEGMTWSEWVNSEYNTGGFTIIQVDEKNVVGLNELCECNHCVNYTGYRDPHGRNMRYKKIIMTWYVVNTPPYDAENGWVSEYEYYTQKYAHANSKIDFAHPAPNPDFLEDGVVTYPNMCIECKGITLEVGMDAPYGEEYENYMIAWE